MSIAWIINSVASAILLPPLNLILLCGLGLVLRRRWPRFGTSLSVVALIVLAIISTRAGGLLFIAPLENMNPPLTSVQHTGAQAIVVLGGGRIRTAPEYAGVDSPKSIVLQRLRYAAKLQRDTQLPILVTGGSPDGSVESEAAIMARVLQHDFAVPVKWQEQLSNNTAENAQFSSRILRAAGIHRVLLVTDAMHMQRARRIFEQAGLEVVAAPTVFLSRETIAPADFLPSTLHQTAYAMHEWLGLVWYGVRY